MILREQTSTFPMIVLKERKQGYGQQDRAHPAVIVPQTLITTGKVAHPPHPMWHLQRFQPQQ